MDFGKFSKELDSKIEKLLNEWRNEVGKASSSLLPLADQFIASCKGGKRLRGNLVILGYQLTDYLGGEILKVAAAYEILHSAILAHDDIIDQSPMRRGRPSLYKSAGVEQAITLADLGFFLATRIIAESKFPEKLKNQALRMFSKTMIDTAIGQMLDIQKSLPAGRQGDPLTIMELKTAKYTVCGPLQLGALLGGAKLDLLDQLDKFGTNLGIAFQIKDNILDGEVESADQARSQALEYMEKARKVIPRLTQDTKMGKVLNDLVDYMIERKK